MGCKKGVWHKTWPLHKKIEIVTMHLDNKVTSTELCKRYGVSPSLVYVWSNLYLKYGVEGLQRKSKVGKIPTKLIE